jgi:hypothetical protein
VLLSVREYNRLTTQTQSFWDAYSTFAETADLPHLAIAPQVFDDVRDQSGGREVSW